MAHSTWLCHAPGFSEYEFVEFGDAPPPGFTIREWDDPIDGFLLLEAGIKQPTLRRRRWALQRVEDRRAYYIEVLGS